VGFLSRFSLLGKNDESTTKNYDVGYSLNHQIETIRITPKEIDRETSKDDELRDLCIKLQTEKTFIDPELLSKF
jgi:hypothetical protein